MVRTAQTAGTDVRPIHHTSTFTDHSGRSAIRVRKSDPDDPIPENFHTHPLVCFQVYINTPLDLEERPSKRAKIPHFEADSQISGTVLGDLVNYLNISAQRPPPLWEIYSVEGWGALECVEHQRREIASRKKQRDQPGIAPIPKINHDLSQTNEKLGFCIVIDSDSFKHTDEPGTGPQWIFFDRRTPTAIDWSPRQRLRSSSIFGPEPAFILPEKLGVEVVRVQESSSDMQHDFGEMYFFSCGIQDPPLAGPEVIMDVGWQEDEGEPGDGRPSSTAEASLSELAARLDADRFKIEQESSTRIVISNASEGAEPDLRYLIYAPCLLEEGTSATLMDIAKAFTQAVASRLSTEPAKSVHFEVYKPSSADKTSMIQHYRSRELPADFTGALTTFTNRDGEAGDKVVRAHPIARTESAADNDPEAVDFEPYKTFLVILEELDFLDVPGCVSFLLADGGRYIDEDRVRYPEMLLWRSAGLDEVSRRLEMRFGGVDWVPPPEQA